MQFLFPWMLVGAAGISVPIAIHLLNRYRYKVVDWGAMELLRKALIVRARRIKLEDLLLLTLRCLIILLIVLALARPVITPEGAPWLAKNNNVSVVIAMDASFSMGHRPLARSRFDRAADRVREIAKTLKPGNPVTLVLLGDRPRFLLRNEGYDADRFEAKLKEAAPLPERLNIETCLDEISQKKFLDEIKAPVVEFYLVSDAQASTWSSLSEKARQSFDQLAQHGKVFFLPAGADGSENLAITRFDLKTGLVRKGVTVEVEVGNFGLQPRDNVGVSLLVNDVAVDQGIVEKLEPNKSKTIALFARIDKAGPARLTARLDADELLVDNVRHAVVDIRDKTRVLYVRSASAETNPADDKDFVLTALAPIANEALVVDAVNQFEMAAKKLSDYQVVILANVPDLPDEQLRTLYYFVKEGGGLIVFLGDNTEPGLINERLRQDGVSFLPAQLLERAGDPKGSTVETVEHPLSHVIGGLPSQVTGEARVFRYVKMKLSEGGRAAMKLTGGDPIIAEKKLGRGSVVVFASAPEPTWTNMVVEPGFYPILIHEAVTFVCRRDHERPFTVSQALSLPLPVSVKEQSPIKQVTFQTQGGAPTTRDVETQDGQPYAKLPVAEQPGFYEIRADQPMAPLVAAVNVDPAESRVQTLSTEALADSLSGLKVRLVGEGDSLESSIRESRVGRELWKEVLLLLLALLVAEALLARWFTRQKIAATPEDAAA